VSIEIGDWEIGDWEIEGMRVQEGGGEWAVTLLFVAAGRGALMQIYIEPQGFVWRRCGF
jgi:hypothetical protein